MVYPSQLCNRSVASCLTVRYRPILLKNSTSGGGKILSDIEAIKNSTRFRLIGPLRTSCIATSTLSCIPPSLKRTSRLITPRFFPASVEKEFFNRIGQKRSLHQVFD